MDAGFFDDSGQDLRIGYSKMIHPDPVNSLNRGNPADSWGNEHPLKGHVVVHARQGNLMFRFLSKEYAMRQAREVISLSEQPK